MERFRTISLVFLSVFSTLPVFAKDESFRISKAEFDKQVTSIAVLRCEDQISSSINEQKEANKVFILKLHKQVNTGFSGMMVQPGVEIKAAEEEAKAWTDRLAGRDRPFVLRCLEIADSAMIESLSSTNRFILTNPGQCAELKTKTFVEYGVLTRADTMRLMYDPPLQRAIADSFIHRLPGDAVMNLYLRFHPVFQDGRATLFLYVTIMSKARELYWGKWCPLADIDDKTDLTGVLNSGKIEKAISKMVKPFKR